MTMEQLMEKYESKIGEIVLQQCAEGLWLYRIRYADKNNYERLTGSGLLAPTPYGEAIQNMHDHIADAQQ